MSTGATSTNKPASSTGSTVKPPSTRAADKVKGKGKSVEVKEDENGDDEEEDDEEDDEMDEDDDEDDDDDEETFDEIDPSAIVGRRTRGVKVDYTSTEALRKAGLAEEEGEDEGEESFTHDETAKH